MTRLGLRRAVAVVAAALCGGATAYLVVPESWSSPGPRAVTGSVSDAGPGGFPGSLPQAAGPRPETTYPSAAAVPGTAAQGAFPAPSAATPDAGEPAPPTRLVVDRLGIESPVVPQGVDDQGRMALPEDPGVAGWYRFGPAPASPAGAVVVAAHIDSRERGIGPFARLSAVRAGDRVLVEAGGTQWRYDVTEVLRVGKDTAGLERFFARDGAPRLHLVTCTGRYDPSTGYEANLVVVADRAERAA